MNELVNKVCGPCNNLTPRLTPDQVSELSQQVPSWQIEDNAKLRRRWKFKDFNEAIAFVNKVGAIAESEGHHPDIAFGWGYAEITTSTHAIKALSENDFILAAKIDAI
jgi:4a-hydroxytetrahydrobiopterin dehydratase